MGFAPRNCAACGGIRLTSTPAVCTSEEPRVELITSIWKGPLPIGWRGMLWIGVLPALSVFYVRKFVKEPPIWLENRRRQRVEQRRLKMEMSGA